jgi:hypothetical protein
VPVEVLDGKLLIPLDLRLTQEECGLLVISLAAELTSLMGDRKPKGTDRRPMLPVQESLIRKVCEAIECWYRDARADLEE